MPSANPPLMPIRRKLSMFGVALLAALLTTAVVPTSTPAAAQEAVRIEDPIVVTSFDGTPIVATLMLPPSAAPESPVPVVLETHGWAGTRRTTAGGIAGRLLDRGYALLTWDSRGFGQSGGVAGPGGPPEVGDAMALIDYLATRPEILLDGPGDPRVGWIGGSNAGGVQINTAAVDHRIDAIVPEIAWGDLHRDLWPAWAPKLAWGEALYAGGLATALLYGLQSPAGPQLGAFPPQLHLAQAEMLAVGRLDPATEQWFTERSTTLHSGAVTAPTLLIQGSIDTLFPLEDAFDNYRNLTAAGTPLKLVVYCSGHSLVGCRYGPNGNADDAVTGEAVSAERILAWMDRWVRGDGSVDTGPGVEWQAQDGRYYSAASWPLPGTVGRDRYADAHRAAPGAGPHRRRRCAQRRAGVGPGAGAHRPPRRGAAGV